MRHNVINNSPVAIKLFCVSMSLNFDDIASASAIPKGDNSTSKNSSTSKINRKPLFPGLGIFCCIMSGVVFSFNALLVKIIKSNNANQLAASRCILQYLFLMPYVTYNWKYKCQDIFGPPGMFKFLIIRGFAGSTAGICLYESIQRISAGDAVTLFFSNVTFAGILGYFFLKEKFTMFDAFMSVIAMAGVILISKPSFLFGGLGDGTENILGVFFGLGSGIFSSVAIIVIRKLGKKTPASLNVLYYSLSGSTTTAVIALATQSFSFPCWHEVPFIMLLGLTGLFAQYLMTVGLHYERANTYAVLRSFQIVFVFILEVAILKDEPSTLSLVGSGLIFSSVFALAMRKLFKANLRENCLPPSAKSTRKIVNS